MTEGSRQSGGSRQRPPRTPSSTPVTRAPRRLTRQSGMFLKGPIPWPWLSRAGQLPGKALHVAVVVHLLAGMRRGGPVSLSGARLRELGVGRHAAYRALQHLEKAGLVDVQRHRDRQPVVTVLPTEADQGRRDGPAS